MKNVLVVGAIAVLLAACASAPPAPVINNASLPEAVRVPAGQTQKLWTVGKGEITYECRERTDVAGQYAWAFVAPNAKLLNTADKEIGKYYAGPTWEAADGSKVTGKQQAVAPGGAGNIPLQLVKADPATGSGAMQGVSYIQRLNTKGGVAPSDACTATNKGERKQVTYAADYVFYGS